MGSRCGATRYKNPRLVACWYYLGARSWQSCNGTVVHEGRSGYNHHIRHLYIQSIAFFLMDFLSCEGAPADLGEFDVISNPPYGPSNRLAVRFAEKALERCDGYVALLLTAKFDFGSTRTHLFRDCDRFCAKVALMDRVSWLGNGETGTEDHAWYIWGPIDMTFTTQQILYERNSNKGIIRK